MRDKTRRRKRLSLLSILLLLTFVAGVVFANIQGFLWFDGYVAVRGQPAMPHPILRWELPRGPNADPAPWDRPDGWGWHNLSAPVNVDEDDDVGIYQWIMYNNDPETPSPLARSGFANPPRWVEPFMAPEDYRATRASFIMNIYEYGLNRGGEVFFDLRNHIPQGMTAPPGSGGRVRITAIEASAMPFSNTGARLEELRRPPTDPPMDLPALDGGAVTAWYNQLTAGTPWLDANPPTTWINGQNIIPIHELVGRILHPDQLITVGIRLTVNANAAGLPDVDFYEDPPLSENMVSPVRPRAENPPGSGAYGDDVHVGVDRHFWTGSQFWIRVHYEWDLPPNGGGTPTPPTYPEEEEEE